MHGGNRSGSRIRDQHRKTIGDPNGKSSSPLERGYPVAGRMPIPLVKRAFYDMKIGGMLLREYDQLGLIEANGGEKTTTVLVNMSVCVPLNISEIQSALGREAHAAVAR